MKVLHSAADFQIIARINYMDFLCIKAFKAAKQGNKKGNFAARNQDYFFHRAQHANNENHKAANKQ